MESETTDKALLRTPVSREQEFSHIRASVCFLDRQWSCEGGRGEQSQGFNPLGLGCWGGMAETAAVLGSLWPEASVPSVLTHTGLPQLHLITSLQTLKGCPESAEIPWLRGASDSPLGRYQGQRGGCAGHKGLCPREEGGGNAGHPRTQDAVVGCSVSNPPHLLLRLPPFLMFSEECLFWLETTRALKMAPLPSTSGG